MNNDKKHRIKVLPDGPYQVSGANLLKMKPVLNSAGRPHAWETAGPIDHADSYELCRCGASSNKPFCDWTHVSIHFNGTETANLAPFSGRAKHYEGQGLVMMDDKPFCVHAGFCVSEKTDVWELVDQAQDEDSRAELIRMIRLCPSGRLAYKESLHEPPVEEDYSQEIGIVEDGPIYVRGGIDVEGANGQNYEKQNRMTLCRCGASKNKPFCDGTHAEIGFKDKI
jgi:CDGSH-type Zn-finger protein